MSIYPGKAAEAADGKYNLDMADSMALAIEKEMNDLFPKIKGYPLPDTGREDRQILYVAIARGILGYLQEWQQQFMNTITIDDAPYADYSLKVKDVDLNIDMDKKG